MSIDAEKITKFVDAFSLWSAALIYIPTYYLNIIPVRQIEIWLKIRSKE